MEFNPKMPLAMSAEDMVARDRLAHEKFPGLFKLYNILDDIEIWFEVRILERFRRIKYYISNVRNSTHAIKTGRPMGQWQDTMDKLFHGTFQQIIYFVNEEAKSDFEYYLDEGKEREDYPEHQTDCYDTCLAAKHWYEVTYPNHLKVIDNLQDTLPDTPISDDDKKAGISELGLRMSDKEPGREERRKEIYGKTRKIEERIEKEKIHHMQEIARINNTLWS
jgi:hypothetical protein